MYVVLVMRYNAIVPVVRILTGGLLQIMEEQRDHIPIPWFYFCYSGGHIV